MSIENFNCLKNQKQNHLIIDTHCHLDDERLLDDLNGVLFRANAANVGNIIIPGADFSNIKKAQKIAENYENVFFAVGTHPYHLDTHDFNAFNNFINHPKCVAIGECGLDYHYELNAEQKALQKKIFTEQIEFSLKHQKPLIIHTRDANADTLELLRPFKNDLAKKAVFHCFNACEMLLEFDFYFGIGGVLTFKNAKKLVEILPKIPLNRLLLETDAPYLTPHPHRGKTNESSYLPLVVAKISEILGIKETEVIKITEQNAKELFWKNKNQ